MDLRKQIRIAIGGALAAQEGSDGAADAVMEVLAKQEPYAFAVNFPESSRVELVHDLDEAYEDMTYEAYEVRKLYLAPGAQPAPSMPDTHNDMVMGLDYQGAMSCARQRANQEAGLLYPEGDARKEEMERELAGEYYRQYTTPNQGAKP